MTLRQKIGQHLIIGIKGPQLLKEEEDFIVQNNISGIILFDRNLDDPKQLLELNLHIQSLRHKMPSKAPLFIGIDMEGGRVHRLKAPFTQWPAVANLGAINSPSLSYKFSEAMGRELKAIGINLDFAPCVDVLTNSENQVIGDRAISSDPEVVMRNASALVRGYVNAGVLTCAKHFPGHGNTLIDSHEDLPREQIDLETLEAREIQCFKKAFRARVDMVMPAHILFEKIDPENPVTFSEKFLKEILPATGYKKITISDDLDMKALTNHYAVDEIPVKALNAGCNMLLYCNEPDSPSICIDSIEKAVAEKKISESYLDKNIELITKTKESRIKDPEPGTMDEVATIIGHPEHLNLARAIANREIPSDIST